MLLLFAQRYSILAGGHIEISYIYGIIRYLQQECF